MSIENGKENLDFFFFYKNNVKLITLLIWLVCIVHHEKCWASEAQAGIKITGRNINNSRYADNTTLVAESEEE